MYECMCECEFVCVSVNVYVHECMLSRCVSV
jgi:hypothetical protein